ncbi:MAG: hypothetical protein ACOC16_02230 [Nanoarchaeota archaeon]
MIDLFPFTIGFIIYLFFNIITFKVYSKKEETINKVILFLIYVYYTILAAYVIQLVDYSIIYKNYVEIIIQIVLFGIAGGLFMIHYYISHLKPMNEKYDTKFNL